MSSRHLSGQKVGMCESPLGQSEYSAQRHSEPTHTSSSCGGGVEKMSIGGTPLRGCSQGFTHTQKGNRKEVATQEKAFVGIQISLGASHTVNGAGRVRAAALSHTWGTHKTKSGHPQMRMPDVRMRHTHWGYPSLGDNDNDNGGDNDNDVRWGHTYGGCPKLFSGCDNDVRAALQRGAICATHL